MLVGVFYTLCAINEQKRTFIWDAVNEKWKENVEEKKWKNIEQIPPNTCTRTHSFSTSVVINLTFCEFSCVCWIDRFSCYYCCCYCFLSNIFVFFSSYFIYLIFFALHRTRCTDRAYRAKSNIVSQIQTPSIYAEAFFVRYFFSFLLCFAFGAAETRKSNNNS